MPFPHPLRRWLTILGATLVSSYVCALVFVLLIAGFKRGISIGSFDLARVVMAVPGLSFGALPSALVVFPFALWSLWEARLARSFGIALAIALLIIGATTPFIGWWAWPFSVVATLLALEFCHMKFGLRRRETRTSPAQAAAH